MRRLFRLPRLSGLTKGSPSQPQPQPAPPSPDEDAEEAPGQDDWQVNDQAECLIEGPWWLAGLVPVAGPTRGEVRVVVATKITFHPETGRPNLHLGFARYGSQWFPASGFRKIRPQPDAAQSGDLAWFDQLVGSPGSKVRP